MSVTAQSSQMGRAGNLKKGPKKMFTGSGTVVDAERALSLTGRARPDSPESRQLTAGVWNGLLRHTAAPGFQVKRLGLPRTWTERCLLVLQTLCR